MNKIKIDECITQIKKIMKEKLYSKATIKEYNKYFDDFLSFCNERNYEYFKERIGLDYLKERYNFDIKTLVNTTNNHQKFSIPLRIIRMISTYSYNQTFVSRFSRYHESIEKNNYWEPMYNNFMNYLKNDCDYKKSTIKHKELTVRSMINIIIQKKIDTLDDINAKNIDDIISQFIHEAPKSITHRIGEMKQFFSYCFNENLCKKDISLIIPNIKSPHSTHLPISWNIEDAKKLLDSIDRDNPVGKRDYAILLMACRLGLRAIDLITVELSDFNWETKIITIKQKKTNHTITFPLLNDIGWAVIDYIKNGRPKTSDKKLFIRNIPPYNGFSNSTALERIFKSRMEKAGIPIPRDKKYGIHSLRHTLGRILLEKETSLPVISQILGHQSIQSTESYLHINMKGLESCPLDPNRVFDE